GPVDITGRALSEPLAQRLGSSVLVVNKGGAGGNIGAEEVAHSAPDGHTVVLALDSMLTVNPYFLWRHHPGPGAGAHRSGGRTRQRAGGQCPFANQERGGLPGPWQARAHDRRLGRQCHG